MRGGVTDVLVSNQVVGTSKLRRLAALAADATIGLCFDTPEQVDAAARVATRIRSPIDGLVEIEVGMQRCGVEPGPPPSISPGASPTRRASVPRAAGLSRHRAAPVRPSPTASRRLRAPPIRAKAIDALLHAGLPCEEVSGAGTGTFQFEARSGVYTELQVGSYVFMDVDYARIGGRRRRPLHGSSTACSCLRP